MNNRKALYAAIVMATSCPPQLARSQVVFDPSSVHVTSLERAGNGVPVVNLSSPSHSGVSRNQYDQFNVGTEGLILNNARDVTQTQLAGYVVGNPNLTGRAAAIIVNEVTSTVPTQLRGFTEVAGPSAEVVISNPNGITCNGCGFINTPRSVLTTGTPTFGTDGGLAAFRVAGGDLRIDGNGLSATGVARMDLIARAVSVNARVWANELNVVTGINEIAHAGLSVHPMTGSGGPGRVGLDVAALGGMYATKIRLIGTEAGVGIRNAGELASQQGDFRITQAGHIELTGKLASAGTLDVEARSISSDGVVAGRNVVIRGSEGVENGGVVRSSGNLDIAVDNALTNRGDIQADQGLTLRVGNLDNRSSIDAGTALTLDVAGKLTNTGSMRSEGPMSGDAREWLNTGGVSAGGDTRLTAHEMLLNAGEIVMGGNAEVRAKQVINNGRWEIAEAFDLRSASMQIAGTINAKSMARVRAGSLDIDPRGALVGADLDVESENIARIEGTLQAASHLSLTAGSFDVSESGLLHAGGDISLITPGGAVNAGQIYAGGNVLAQFATLTNSRLIRSEKGLEFRGTQRMVNQGDVQAGLSILASTDGAIENAGNLHALNGSLSLASGKMLTNSLSGDVYAAASATLAARDMRNDGTIETGSDMELASRSSVENHGTLRAGKDFALRSQGFLSRGPIIVGSTAKDGSDTGSAKLAVADVAAIHGPVGVAGDFSLRAGQIRLEGASLRAGGDATLQSGRGDIVTSEAEVIAGKSLSLIAGGQMINRHGLLQGAGLSLVGAGLDNENGRIVQTGVARQILDVAGPFVNDGGRIVSHGIQFHLRSLELSNRGGQIRHAGAGELNLTTAGILSNAEGSIRGEASLLLDARCLANASGHVTAARDLSLVTTRVDNRTGSIAAGGDLAWTTRGAILANENGELGSRSNVTLSLAAMDNAGGVIAAGNDASVTLSGSLSGRGRILAERDLDVRLPGDFVNEGASMFRANRHLRLEVDGTLRNADGATLESPGELSLSARAIDNGSDARISSATTVLSTAGHIVNLGRLEGDRLVLRAAHVANIGSVVGDDVEIRSGDLTNGPDFGTEVDGSPYQGALIAATRQLQLLIAGRLLNRDATLFSLGDLSVAGETPGGMAQSIVNRSGSIEADGSMHLAGEQVVNERRVFETERIAVPDGSVSSVAAPVVRFRHDDKDTRHKPPYVDASHIADATEIARARSFCQAAGYKNNRCTGLRKGRGSPTRFEGVETYSLIDYERLKRTSSEGRIAAGDNVSLVGSIINDKSIIAAGGNLSVNGVPSVAAGDIRNIAWSPTGRIRTQTSLRVGWESLVHGHRRWLPNGSKEYGATTSYAVAPLDAGRRPRWIGMDVGPTLSARMTAGNRLDLRGHDLTNTTVGRDDYELRGLADSDPAEDAAPGYQDAGPAELLQRAHRERVAGPRPGAQIVGDISAPAGRVRLPVGGLYTVHPGPAHRYLIETDARFASRAGFLGSEYLMRRVGFDGEARVKRLGDGFLEQRRVLDQITSLTGRRYLGANTTALGQYRALMDAGVRSAQRFNLAIGVALTEAQMASLSEDMVWLVRQDVAGESVLVPVVYLSARTARGAAGDTASLHGRSVHIDVDGHLANGGAINADADATVRARTVVNDGSLGAAGSLGVTAVDDIRVTGQMHAADVDVVAGRDITVSSAPDEGGPRGASIQADSRVHVRAARDLLLDGTAVIAGGDAILRAGRDNTMIAGTVRAGAAVAVEAGRDLALQARGHTVATHGGVRTSEVSRHAVTSVQAGESVSLIAGHDLGSSGSLVDAGSHLTLEAGHDMVLDAVTDRLLTETSSWSGKKATTVHTADESLTGTSLSAGTDLMVTAGHDVTATGATLASARGTASVAAGRDVKLEAGQETHEWQKHSKSVKSRALSKTVKRSSRATRDVYAVGTVITGEQVAIAAGRDIATHAAQIASDGLLIVSAGNDISIAAGQNTHMEEASDSVRKAGVMSGGGFSIMLGGSKEMNTYRAFGRETAASMLGSTKGDVLILAGNDVRVTGSNIMSGRDMAISGQSVTVEAAVDTRETRETEKKQRGGITVGLTGGVVSAIEATYGAVKKKSRAQDSRLKTLYAAEAAASAYDAYNSAASTVAAMADGAAPSDVGISVRIGIGASSSSSDVRTRSETAVASNIRAGGRMQIVATGADLNIVGSRIDARDVGLQAARNLNILSQKEDHSSKSTNKNGSGEVGISVGSQTGIYVTASAGKGKATGNGTTHAESLISASDTLSFSSGSDTTVQGGIVSANRIVGAVGGNLTLRSEQDTDDYASKQTQAGGTLVYGYGGSANYSSKKEKGHSSSVSEVSGMRAGDDGFQLLVGGNTHLAGAVIDSTADPERNILNTQSLSHEAIVNKSSAKATGMTASVAIDANAPGEKKLDMSGTGPALPADKSRREKTISAIAGGTLVLRNGSTSDISRDPGAVGGQVRAYKPGEISARRDLLGGLVDASAAVTDALHDRRTAGYTEEIEGLKDEARTMEAAGDSDGGQALREKAFMLTTERDNPGMAPARVKTMSALAISALSGDFSLGSLATYGALSRVGDDWKKAGRAFQETQAVRVTCGASADSCAGGDPANGLWSKENTEGTWELPAGKGVTLADRMSALNDHGFKVEFVDQIPDKAKIIGTNGILNDLPRASQVFVGYAEMDEPRVQGTTFYLQYNQTHGGVSDLMQAAWDKTVSPALREYSKTSRAVADAVSAQGENSVRVLGHSWGSITTRNALQSLDQSKFSNPELSVAVMGAAVRPKPLVEAMKNITAKEAPELFGRKDGKAPQLVFLNHPDDPVSAFVGMNLLPSVYLDPRSGSHMPGASRSSVWGSLKGFGQVFGGSVNPHSCQGLNCRHNPIMNWTIDSAEKTGSPNELNQ